MSSIYLNKKRLLLSPSQSIGKGGEADIYDIGNGIVLKLYKLPNDPDYALNPTAQQGAAQRILEQQTKLPAFPKTLPRSVVGPIELAYSSKELSGVVGFTMSYLTGCEVLLQYANKAYRENGGIQGRQIVDIFSRLHELVADIHAAGVVIGDFNDLNVLVDRTNGVHIVDADSMQFDRFMCRTFTTRFVDPLVCETNQLVMARPHNMNSDWYAFTTMLMQSLLFVGPYGGVHKPKSGKKLQHDARVLVRATIFGNNVVYPKPALHFNVLPDELLNYLERVYVRDERGIFPLPLLQELRWTTCANCGAIHARTRCPQCSARGAVKEKTVVRGSVVATYVFRTKGQILTSTVQDNKLSYLYHEHEEFFREGGRSVLKGVRDPELKFRISGDKTLLGKGARLVVLSPSQAPEQLQVDQVGLLPIFDTNEHATFWIQNGQLMRSRAIGSGFIGNVLQNRTLFWVGKRFGLGFFQAGALMRTFVFKTDVPGLHDQVRVPELSGQIVDATCYFSDTFAWFMVQTQEQGKVTYHCYVVDIYGDLVAQEVVEHSEDSWLSHGIRGYFAVGSSLFGATDEGIVRMVAEQGVIRIAQTFPDTEPFVDSYTRLHSAADGIYAVNGNNVVLLKIQQNQTI